MKIIKKYFLVEDFRVKDNLGNIYTINDLVGFIPDDILVDEDLSHAYAFFDGCFDIIILDDYEVL